MKQNYTTQRLTLQKLTGDDADFIHVLVNTEGWIKFIGDRNVKSAEDAKAYIQKILANQNINYWVVKLQSSNTSIGIITFIKRDYLDHPDIGFAFLPEYAKKGYAFEAATVVLEDGLNNSTHPYILATTLKENEKSIHLLEKLGLQYLKEIENEKDRLLVYSINTKLRTVSIHQFLQ
jgi:RimJ/RimL family protein N-acetyltransferase